MRRTLFSLSLFILLCCSLGAAEFPVPPQEITVMGGDTVPLGELVILKVSEIKEKPPELQQVSYVWKIFDCSNGRIIEKDRVRAVEDEVLFGAGIQPKSVYAEVAVTYLYITKKGDVIEKIGTETVILSKTVTIGGGTPPGPNPGPAPNPGPGPVPPPNPVVPDGKFGMTKFSYDEAQRVKSDYRARGSLALAKSFAGISAAIAAGTIKTPQELLKTTFEENNNSLQNAKVPEAEWQEWGVALQDKLWDLYQQKQLVTMDDYRECWAAISTGLEAVSTRSAFGKLIRE